MPRSLDRGILFWCHMIRRLYVKNYKALRSATLELTRLHALIGPNDSGKTSLLEALAVLCRGSDNPIADSFPGSWRGRELVTLGADEPTIRFEATLEDAEGQLTYALDIAMGEGRNAVVRAEWLQAAGQESVNLTKQSSGTSLRAHANFPKGDLCELSQRVVSALNPALFLRWSARTLALPSMLDPDRRFRLDPSGFGLPSVLDAILSEDHDRFMALVDRFKAIFPQVETIQVPLSDGYRAHADPLGVVQYQTAGPSKAIRFRFRGQTQAVPASQASDGLLYVLGYLALLYSPEPPKVLLIEEPENGIYPNLLREVLRILRQLIEEHPETQVLMTTHSPYVVDEFAPNEVTLCRRQEDGSVALKRLSDSETVRKQMDVFTLGEIWAGEGDAAIAAEPAEAAQS